MACVITKVGKPNQGSGKHKGGSRGFCKKTCFKQREDQIAMNRTGEETHFVSFETQNHLFSILILGWRVAFILILYFSLNNVQFVAFHSRIIVYYCTLEETIRAEDFVIQFCYPVATSPGLKQNLYWGIMSFLIKNPNISLNIDLSKSGSCFNVVYHFSWEQVLYYLSSSQMEKIH